MSQNLQKASPTVPARSLADEIANILPVAKDSLESVRDLISDEAYAAYAESIAGFEAQIEIGRRRGKETL